MTDVSTTCVVVTGIKTESIRKLSNFNYQWTKTLHQNNLNNIAFFFTFFKDCHLEFLACVQFNSANRISRRYLRHDRCPSPCDICTNSNRNHLLRHSLDHSQEKSIFPYRFKGFMSQLGTKLEKFETRERIRVDRFSDTSCFGYHADSLPCDDNS